MPGGNKKLDRGIKKCGVSSGVVISGGEGGEPEVYASFAHNYDAQEFRKCHSEFMGQLKHKHLYPLVGEIDRCLKKVSEGVEDVEDVWQKFQSAQGTSQKEKFEQDLKKEIKKLQRLRDQIKVWIQDSDIKDKTMLQDTKKLIETQMERFKGVEREMKIKTYSKIGLENSTQKVDPVTLELEEVNGWIINCLEQLDIQIDHCESEIELLLANKKKRSNPEEQDRLEQLKSNIERHRFHIVKLETLMRLMDELTSDVNYCVSRLRRFLSQVKGIQEDVDYYLEEDANPDLEEIQLLYEEIEGIDEVEPVQQIGTVPLLPTDTETDDLESDPPAAINLDSSTLSHGQGQGQGRFSETERMGKDENGSDGSKGNCRLNEFHAKLADCVSYHNSDSDLNFAEREPSEKIKSLMEDEISLPVPPLILPSLTSSTTTTTTFKDVVSRSCNSSEIHPHDSHNPKNNNKSHSHGTQPKASSSSCFLEPKVNNVNDNPGLGSHLKSAWNSKLLSLSASFSSVSSSSPSKGNNSLSRSHAILNHKSMTSLGKPVKGRAKDSSRSSSTRSTLTTVTTISRSDRNKSKERSSSVPGSSSSARKHQREKPRSLNLSHSQGLHQGQGQSHSNSSFSSNNSYCEISPDSLHLHSTMEENVKADPKGQGQESFLVAQSNASKVIGSRSNSNSKSTTFNSSDLDNSEENLLDSFSIPFSASGNAEEDDIRNNNCDRGQVDQKEGQESKVNVKEAFIPALLSAAPLGPFPLRNEHLRQFQMLEASHRNMPLSSCAERFGQLLPRSPYVTPSYYPQTPIFRKEPDQFYRNYTMETLFFIFYYAEGSKAQLLAAKVLKERMWRFHTKYNMWFQRHDLPTVTTDLYEQGTYIYFDYDKWCQRKKEGFLFEYQYLEDNDF